MTLIGRRLGFPPNDLVSFQVLGDSMEPALRDGDIFLAHRVERQSLVAAIYAIEVDGDMSARRLHQRVDGALVVSTDGIRYEALVTELGRDRPFRVLGLVAWISGPIRDWPGRTE